MPDGTLTSISGARQAVSADGVTDFDKDNGETSGAVVLDLPQVRPDEFNPAVWLAIADAACVRVTVVVQRDELNSVWFAEPHSDAVQLLRVDGSSKQRIALVAAYILSNEPGRVCVAGEAA